MDQWLRENLLCPRDHDALELRGAKLVCPSNHTYPVIEGIPIMLLDDVVQTQWPATATLEEVAAIQTGQQSGETREAESRTTVEPNGVHPYVQRVIASTCGNLYLSLVNNLRRYPIPELRLPRGAGEMFLDIGCNWGRWSVAAAQKGYSPVGIDPHLDAIRAATKICRQRGLSARFIVGDSRFLPFAPNTFDIAFSFGVLQHFSKVDARLSLEQIPRVLKARGTCLIQMANKFGIRSLYHLVRRGFKEGEDFEVRYWSVPELRKAFTETIGPTSMSVDGFFGLGLQASDLDLLPLKYRAVVRCSEVLRAMSRKLPWMTYFADSVYVKSRLG